LNERMANGGIGIEANPAGAIRTSIARILPDAIKQPVRWAKGRIQGKRLRAAALAWHRGLPHEQQLLMHEEIQWIRDHGVAVFPYPWAVNIQHRSITVSRERDGMPYVSRGGRRLFFPRPWNDAKVSRYYATILLEQYEHSPHRYTLCKSQGRRGSVLFDIGAAEGVWALDNADLARHIVLCEPNLEWHAPLARTFGQLGVPWVVLDHFVSDVDGQGRSRLDTIAEPWRDAPFAIKMDIEGEEARALQGARSTLQRQRSTLWEICLYHTPADQERLPEFFARNTAGIVSLDVSEGFMMFTDERPACEPFLRRSLLRVSAGTKVHA
jgi:hypothetical protein